MALSLAAVQAVAQTVFTLSGQVLKLLQAVSKAHLQRQKELELLKQLQGKVQSRYWPNFLLLSNLPLL